VRLGRPAWAPRRTASVNSVRCRILDSLGSTSGHPLAAPGPAEPSGAEARAALVATRRENGTAGAGAHAQPEAVGLRPAAVVRLERALAHRNSRRVDCMTFRVTRAPSARWACGTGAAGLGLRTLMARGASVKPGTSRPARRGQGPAGAWGRTLAWCSPGRYPGRPTFTRHNTGQRPRLWTTAQRPWRTPGQPLTLAGRDGAGAQQECYVHNLWTDLWNI